MTHDPTQHLEHPLPPHLLEAYQWLEKHGIEIAKLAEIDHSNALSYVKRRLERNYPQSVSELPEIDGGYLEARLMNLAYWADVHYMPFETIVHDGWYRAHGGWAWFDWNNGHPKRGSKFYPTVAEGKDDRANEPGRRAAREFGREFGHGERTESENDEMSGTRHTRTLIIQLVENDPPTALVQLRIASGNSERYSAVNPDRRPTVIRDTIIDAVDIFLNDIMHGAAGDDEDSVYGTDGED